MGRKMTIALAALVIVLASGSCLADETKKDYSYLEDMSVKELKELDAAIHSLLGDGAVEQVVDSIETVSSEAETEAEHVLMSTEEFLNDVVTAYNNRSKVWNSYSTSDYNTMSDAEMIDYWNICISEEWPLIEKYDNAYFDDLNIQYLCEQYLKGIKKQRSAVEFWEETKDYEQAVADYDSGYYNRAYTLVELSDYYGLALDDKAVQRMREDTEAMDSLNEAETRNSQIPYETVKEVQQLLHDIGFRCWNIDGVAGKRTVKAIKRFQEMYGFDVDGMIDEELIEQLRRVKTDKGIGVEDETETE